MMCSCDESPYPCSRCRHTSHDPAYFDPQNEVARPEEAPSESLARPSFVCNPDESAGLAEFTRGDFSTLASTLHAVQAERDALAAERDTLRDQRDQARQEHREMHGLMEAAFNRRKATADALAAAEARVEALEAALREIAAFNDFPGHQKAADQRHIIALARAALTRSGQQND